MVELLILTGLAVLCLICLASYVLAVDAGIVRYYQGLPNQELLELRRRDPEWEEAYDEED